MPMPESATVIRCRSPSVRQATRTVPPSGVNLIALPIRFSITCSIRPRSTQAISSAPGRVPVIRTVRGTLDSILEGGGTVLARAVDALDRVNKLLSDKNIATISGTFEDVHAITTEFRSQKDLIAHLDSAISSADAAAKKVAELTDSTNSLVNGDAKRTLANLGDAAEELKGAFRIHFEQPGRIQGTVELDGEKHEVDCFSNRDGGHGPRFLEAAAPGAYVWSTADEKNAWQMLAPNASGAEAKAVAGYILRDGELSPIVDGSRRVLTRDGPRPETVEIRARDQLGRELQQWQ